MKKVLKRRTSTRSSRRNKKALNAEREKRMELRGDIFQPVYCRKIHDKRNWLKSEEVSRTANNKETLKDFVDQKIILMKEEIEVSPIKEIPESPKKLSIPSKPKTAAPIQYKPAKQKPKVAKKRTVPIRLDSMKRIENESEKPEIWEVSSMKWERQEKICNELSNMYENELKRIYEIKARQTHTAIKAEDVLKNKQQQQDRMRRTGGGFTQMNFFPK